MSFFVSPINVKTLKKIDTLIKYIIIIINYYYYYYYYHYYSSARRICRP